MSARKNTLFIAALTACGVIVLAEGALIFERFTSAKAAAKAVEEKRRELAGMAALTPAPTRPIATAIEADLARAQRALGAMQAELKGRGPAGERMAKAKVPAARTDAYFDLATFVERTRELAKKNDVELKPEAARLGFSAYANEGPEADLIESVFHQRQIAQYLVESLIEARPAAVVSVKRERPLTKKEREDRAAAGAAIANGTPPPDPSPDAANTAANDESPDYFVLDPRISVRAPGYVDSTAFRIVFTGQTAALRAFLNRLASFELPVLVREVEVEPASAEESAVANPPEEAAAAPTEQASSAPSVVLLPKAPKAPAGKAAPRAPVREPIVSKPISKFSVTVEYIELVPTAPGT
jgi:hypothetical protein